MCLLWFANLGNPCRYQEGFMLLKHRSHRSCIVTLVNYTITQNQTTPFKLLTSRNSMWKVQTGVSQVSGTLWKFWHDSSGTVPTSATWSTSDQLASNLTQTQLMSRWMYAKKISGVPDPAQRSGKRATWEGSGSAQLKHVQQQHPTTKRMDVYCVCVRVCGRGSKRCALS